MARYYGKQVYSKPNNLEDSEDYGGTVYNGYSGYSGGKSFRKCYESHPPLPLKDGLVIYGGSCNSPIVKDAQVYVGFDHGMRLTSASYPWNWGDDLIECNFVIRDMCPPDNHEEFKRLVEWVEGQLLLGKKVHAGCIGGHGRTGTFFAALVKHMMGIEDAITYVRNNYCKKAVETASQVEYLHEKWGIKKVEGAKESMFSSRHIKGSSYHRDVATLGKSASGTKTKDLEISSSVGMGGGSRDKIFPMQSKKNIWNGI